MQQVSLRKVSEKTPFLEHCFLAKSFLHKARGFLHKSHIGMQVGMLFPACRSIHTLFMRCTIDVVFLKRTQDPFLFVISSTRPCVRPWQFVCMDWHADTTLELAENAIAHFDLLVGGTICISLKS